MIMGEIIEFKKRKEPMDELVQEIFAEIRSSAYQNLLPQGLSQSLVDEFLVNFESILMSMVPPSFIPLIIDESDPNYHTHMEFAAKAQEQINDYVLNMIGKTYRRELLHFVAEQLR